MAAILTLDYLNNPELGMHIIEHHNLYKTIIKLAS